MAIDDKRARLLDAAGHEFAEKGFEGATVRSISERAGVNLAAINYHFGDKERLYEAVLLLAHQTRPAAEPDPPGLDPRVALRRYVARFLEDVVYQRSTPWHQGVMVREIAAPSKAAERLVDESFRPRFERLLAILHDLRPDLDPRRLHALGFSVVGQCLHYKQGRVISERIIGTAAFERLDAAYLVDHVTAVTLAALGRGEPLAGPTELELTSSTQNLREDDR